jgi:hypothetical protein
MKINFFLFKASENFYDVQKMETFHPRFAAFTRSPNPLETNKLQRKIEK